MEFELPKETVEQLGLNEEQVTAITSHVSQNYVPELRGAIDNEYKEKGNKYANGIFDSVRGNFSKLTGVEINEGEKIVDYFSRAGQTYFENKTNELADLKTKYEETVKNGKGSEVLQGKITELETSLDTYKQKEAEYDAIIEGGWKEKYESEVTKRKQTTLDNAFISVKPKFPQSVDEFRAKHFYDEFRKEVESKYEIVKVEDEYVAIDKENEHKRFKLNDLVAKDENLSKLAQGRQQEGLGSTSGSDKTIQGLDFELKENATSGEISAAITKHLKSKGVDNASDDWAKQFKEQYTKVREAQKQTA